MAERMIVRHSPKGVGYRQAPIVAVAPNDPCRKRHRCAGADDSGVPAEASGKNRHGLCGACAARAGIG